MNSARPTPPDLATRAALVAASQAQLDSDPSRMSIARDAMAFLRAKMATDGADPEALELLCRHIRCIDAHLRRGRQTHLKLVPDDIDQVE